MTSVILYMSSSFCSELRDTTGHSPLLPILPSLLSCLAAMATDSPSIVVLVVVDSLQLAATVSPGPIDVPLMSAVVVGGRCGDSPAGTKFV